MRKAKPTPTATSQTAKISGFIAPDFTYDIQADSLVRQGFKVKLQGKNLSNITDSRYLISCDPNRDNTVNMADVIIIAKHFGMTSKDYPEN